MSSFKFGTLANQIGFLVKGTVVQRHTNGFFAISKTPRTLNPNSPITCFDEIYISKRVLNARELLNSSVTQVSPTRTPVNIFCEIKKILSSNESSNKAQLEIVEVLIGNYFKRTPEREVIHALKEQPIPDEIELSNNLCFFSAGTEFERVSKWEYKIKPNLMSLPLIGTDNMRVSAAFLGCNWDSIKEVGGDLESFLLIDNLALSQELLIKKLKHLSTDNDLIMPLISNLECMYSNNEAPNHKSAFQNNEPSISRVQGFLGTL